MDAAQDQVLIKLDGVTKVFYTDELETHALSGIHLEIKKGEYVSIAGPSGCGKSTLLSLLGLLDTPTDGRYMLDDKPVDSLNLNERARIRNREIGFIFQSFNLIGDLTVFENVELPLLLFKMSRKDRRRHVESAMKAAGILDRASHYPRQLSGGQEQRVAIARALVNEPAILLADEPTGNLDSTTSAEVLAVFDQLHDEGQTIIMVTHESSVAAHAERIIRMVDGRIRSDLPADQDPMIMRGAAEAAP